MTGWAQVRYKYGASKEDALEKLQYELYYIKNMSLALDLVIMIHTVKTMISGAEHGQRRPKPVPSVQGVSSMSENVILLEFNELSPTLMNRFISQGHLPNFKRFSEESAVYLTEAEERAPYLDPWIQWITVHTGLNFQRARHRAAERRTHGHGKTGLGLRRRSGQARLDLRQHERGLSHRPPRRRDARSVDDARRADAGGAEAVLLVHSAERSRVHERARCR